MDPVSGYAALIAAIVDSTGMSHPMLHVHAGMAIYLLVQVVLGPRRPGSLAFLAVVAAETLNEVMDRLYYDSWRWPDTLEDIALTLFWPGLCLVVGKLQRRRWQSREEKGRNRAAVAGQMRAATRPLPASAADRR